MGGTTSMFTKPGKCVVRVLSLGNLRWLGWPSTCNAFTDCCSEERGGGRQKSAEPAIASFSTLHKFFFFYAAQIVGLDLPISNCNSSFDSRLNKVEHWNIGELWKLSDKNKAARGRVIIYLPEEESFKE